MKRDISYWKHYLKNNRSTLYSEEDLVSLKILITDCLLDTGLISPTEAMQMASDMIKRRGN